MNKIAIVMPTYNRPYYLIKTVKALMNAENLDKFVVYTYEDKYERENDIIFNRLNKKIEVNRNINRTGKPLDCAGNIVTGIDKTIKKGFDKFIVIEDDVVVSKDYLNYILFAFDNLKDNIKVIQAFTHNTRNEMEDYETCRLVDEIEFFNPWGWGTTSKTWNEYIKHYDLSVYPNRAWAMPYNIYNLRKDIRYLRCRVSRVLNIGEKGRFQADPENFRKKIYNYNYFGFSKHKPLSKEDFKLSNNGFERCKKDVRDMYVSGIISGRDYRKCLDIF